MVGIIRLILFSVALAVGGCGTDVMSLLRDESRLAWDAHETALAASELDLGLEVSMYGAEMAKLTVCQPVDRTVIEYIDNIGKISFGQQLKADLTRLVTLVFPITSVEKCAVAHKVYEREYLALNARLKELTIAPEDAD